MDQLLFCFVQSQLTRDVRRPDAVHVVGVHVLVERPLDEVLRLVPRERPHLLVQEDELEVEAGAEHEHVAEHLDLGDGARRQGVRHGHQAHVLGEGDQRQIQLN